MPMTNIGFRVVGDAKFNQSGQRRGRIATGDFPRAAGALLLAAMLMLAVGCGGGSSGGASPDTTGGATPGDTASNPLGPIGAGNLGPLGQIDPNNLTSSGVVALRILETDLPDLAAFETDVTKAEASARAAVISTLGSLASQQLAQIPSAGLGKASASKALAQGPANRAMALGDIDFGDVGFVASIAPTIFQGVPAGAAPASASGSGTSGGTTATMQMGGGSTGDGNVAAQITLTVKSQGSQGDGSITFGVKSGGRICPDASGSLPFEVSASAGVQAAVQSGKVRAGFQMDLTAKGTARVNDAAYIDNVDFEINIQSSRQRPDGHNAFVDATYPGGSIGGEWSNTSSLSVTSKAILNRQGSTTTRDDVTALTAEARDYAVQLMKGYLEGVQHSWRNGNCVEIRSPEISWGVWATTARPGASIVFNVAVVHKQEGGELKLPVDATLAGQKSLTPSRISSAPGVFVYVAPETPGSSATVTFASTSRRGIGTTYSKVWVSDRSYEASGGGNGLVVSGRIGNLAADFTLEGTFPGASATFHYHPSSDRAGAVNSEFSGSGVTGSTSGTYTIVGPDDGPLTLTQTTTGCVNGIPGSCRTNTDVITLTRVQ
jgi:hypothetical protein